MAKPLILGNFLPYRLSVLSNTISQDIADIYDREFGLDIRQWRVMAVVGETPGASASEVTARTAMDKVAVSRAVAGLIELGYLTREPSAADGRRSELRLTKVGQGIYDQIVPLALQYERDLLARLDAGDVKQLEALMTRLADVVSPDHELW
ncbi:MAG: MarR family winged helix-turn-helix transcriptional regulator [Pseudomonadota bacterium]